MMGGGDGHRAAAEGVDALTRPAAGEPAEAAEGEHGARHDDDADGRDSRGGRGAGGGKPPRDRRYPLAVPYCTVCGLPAEVHEYHSRSQFDKCRPWMAAHCPELFPDDFPEEAAAAKLQALHVDARADPAAAGPASGEAGPANLDAGPHPHNDSSDDDAGGGVKVAVPVEQKGTVGKKKKLPAEILITLAQRKGKKQVSLVYGLDLFGIKLADAAKAAKKKFATGASVARSADNRDVIEIQGTWQEDAAQLLHNVFGIPKTSIFVVDPKTKKKHCPFADA